MLKGRRTDLTTRVRRFKANFQVKHLNFSLLFIVIILFIGFLFSFEMEESKIFEDKTANDYLLVDLTESPASDDGQVVNVSTFLNERTLPDISIMADQTHKVSMESDDSVVVISDSSCDGDSLHSVS
jgi:hypothetical protein